VFGVTEVKLLYPKTFPYNAYTFLEAEIMDEMTRRKFIKVSTATVAASSTLPLFNVGKAQAKKISIGFIALTDCASVVMAKELELFKKYGVDVDVVKQASWAATRDGLLSGDLQAAHCLFGMPFSVHSGIGGPAGKELLIAMILNNNGQAITLEKEFKAAGFDSKKVKEQIDARVRAGKAPTFAMTFPGGTHDMWLRYWMAASGIDQSKVGIIVVPPPQMVANMKVGNMDGYSVGEPWNGVGVKEAIGFTHITSQQIWRHHPEKALVVNKEFSARKDELKAVMKAILEASQWLDVPSNRRGAAKTIGAAKYVNAPADVIDKRLEGIYDMGEGLGEKQFLGDQMMFHRGGETNFPRKGYGIWFLAQYVRFGLLKTTPDYAKVADTLIMDELYKEVAKEMGIKVPTDDMKPFLVTLDKAKFDPANPAAYLAKAKL
jgi:nitrate/nitrite transport system substrate-binding protein